MTVEELLQTLVELAQRGRGQWEVRVYRTTGEDGAGNSEDPNLEVLDVEKEVWL